MFIYYNFGVDVTKTGVRNGEWAMGSGEQWSAVIPKT